MTTAEMTTTISMLNQLSRPQFENVQNYIRILLEAKKSAPKQSALTKKEFLAKIAKAEEDIKNGNIHTWEEVREGSRKKYGF